MAFSTNPMFSPENLLMLSGNILAAPNFGAGLGTGLQQLGTNLAAQKKEQDERQRLLQENRQAGNYLRQQNPGQDLSNFTPGMLKAATASALDKQFAKPKFQVLDDGTYGWVDEQNQKFTPLGRATKPEKLPAIAEEFNWAKDNGFDGSPQEYQVWKANLSKQKGMTVEYDKENGFRMTQGDVDAKPSKITEGQSKDINWLTRGTGANDELGQLDAKLTSLSETTASKLGTPGNYLKSEDYQMAERAGREFLAVVLRKDSGGAITPDEYASYAPTFLPEPGDGPKVIERKRLARERFLDAMQRGLPDEMQSLVPKNDPSTTNQTPDQAAAQPKTITLPDGTQGTIRKTK